MFEALELGYVSLLFLAIYCQVFYLFVFFENRAKLKVSPRALANNELPSVSFLIPCYNEESTVSGTIKSVLSLKYPKHLLQVVVVDDGSKDRTWKVLQSFRNQPQVTLIRQENAGKAEALNRAIQDARGEIVVSFDADTRIKPDALREAVKAFAHDKELMALGGTILIDSPKTFVQRAQSVEYQIFSFTKKMLGFIGGVLALPGAFSLFRREALLKVGGYRNAHNLEDVELTMRMQKHQMKIDHSHLAVAFTKGPESLIKLFKQRLRWCYGFIKNFQDYKSMLFDSRYGNFSTFTLPVNIFSYLMVVCVFFIGGYKMWLFLYDKYQKVVLLGWESFGLLNSSLFYFDARLASLLALIMLSFVGLGIVVGAWFSHGKLRPMSIFYFSSVYSILAPLWVLRSIYNFAFSVKTSWR